MVGRQNVHIYLYWAPVLLMLRTTALHYFEKKIKNETFGDIDIFYFNFFRNNFEYLCKKLQSFISMSNGNQI
jgi:hypothetical protein